MSKWETLLQRGPRGQKYLTLLNKKLQKVATDDIAELRTNMNANFEATLLGVTKASKKSKEIADKINEAIANGSITQGDTVDGFKKQLKGLGLDYGKFGLEMDHKDISVISQQLQLTLDSLYHQKRAYEQRAQGGENVTHPMGSAVRPQTINRVIAKLKELILVEKGLADQWAGEQLDINDISRVVYKMDSRKTGAFNIDKVKDVKAADGRIMTIQIVDNWRHRMKSDIQGMIGARKTHLLLGDDRTDEPIKKASKDMERELAKGKILRIEGSDSIWSGYKKAFTQLITKGNFKPYKSKSGGTWSGMRAPDVAKAKARLRKIAINAAYAKSGLQRAAAGGTVKKEERHGNIAKELIRIRNKVNRKLPKEIQENMGRPALINRTGRFANSAVLADLRPSSTGKTIMAKYTYMLDPYQTFENTGIRKWPLGFNPKPLISRSIRNLAEKETREKFGLGITTRRI